MIHPQNSARMYSGGRFGLVIDGRPQLGYVKAIEGGLISKPIVGTHTGANSPGLKGLGASELEAITVEMGLSSCRDIFNWISESWNNRPSRRSGEILHADANLEAVQAQDFTDALIEEVTFPTLEGGSNALNVIKCKFRPEGGGTLRPAKGALQTMVKGTQKQNVTSLFTLSIEGVRDRMKVAKIDGFTVKQKIATFYYGASELPELAPSSFEFPELAVTIAAADAAALQNWWQETRRESGDQNLRPGAIEFARPDGKELFRIELDNLAIRQFTLLRSEAEATATKLVRCQIAVGRMRLVPGPGID